MVCLRWVEGLCYTAGHKGGCRDGNGRQQTLVWEWGGLAEATYLLHSCAHLLQSCLSPLGFLSQDLACSFFLSHFLLKALHPQAQGCRRTHQGD